MSLSEAHACRAALQAPTLHQRRASPNSSQHAVLTTPVDLTGACSVASGFARPSPLLGRIGIHDFTFEACSRFTRVTACWVALPPYARFVTGLPSGWLPSQSARRLPRLTDIYRGGILLHW